MILTEEDAKTKWCPAARVAAKCDDKLVTVNRDDSGKAHFNMFCIASVCMAWRCVPYEFGQEPNRGYCGLAGKP